MCIRRFPFNRRRNYFSLMRSFGIYIRKARNRETKWRDKAIISSVTHNNVFCNTCCLNWNALITDYRGPSPVSRAWPGSGSLRAAANSIMSLWRSKAAQNCTTSGRGFVRTCKKKQKLGRGGRCASSLEGKPERPHRAVCGVWQGCSRASPWKK